MRLNQVTLPSRDIARAKAFYLTLGLKLVVDAPPHYVRFALPEGDSTLSLHLCEEDPNNAWPMVYFECDDLDARVSALKAKGIQFHLDPTDQEWLWREARLRDPDGNALCLFRAGENRLNPPWAVKE
ncbi:MAG: VOC family protein [Alphaproteobacteria bacterium]|nr:VOC family protein [Alphaproteobacteria bacterium]